MAPIAVTMLRDALAIAAVGVSFGLAANALSPRGVSLTRDYFRAGASATGPAGTVAALPERGSRGHGPRLHQGTAPAATAATAAANTTKRGLPLAGFDEVARAYRDPGFAAGRITFVDARSADRFAAGHIPGALPFDHYRPEQGVAGVLAAAQLAERIVVYCHGGDCEDSELAALDLMALGVPGAKLVIYGGGITEWQQRGMPVAPGGGAR